MSQKPQSKVWELPLRIWHWLFGVSIVVALATGYIDELKSIEVHQWAGISTVSLLAFRLIWGIRGGTYSRWKLYWTTPRNVWNHFTRRGSRTPHTAPGIVLVVILMCAALVQSVSGLFMTDDVFFDGPLLSYASDDIADWADLAHNYVWMLIAVCAGVHLVAQLVYGIVFRNPTPLSMISGNKPVDVTDVRYSRVWLFLSTFVAGVVFTVLSWLSD